MSCFVDAAIVDGYTDMPFGESLGKIPGPGLQVFVFEKTGKLMMNIGDRINHGARLIDLDFRSRTKFTAYSLGGY
jgi:hypothetical protein